MGIDGGPRREPHIVVGVSTSLAGLQALRYAAAEARRRHLRLVAVRAWLLKTGWYGAELDPWRQEMLAEARGIVPVAFEAAMGGVPTDVDLSVAAPEVRPDLALTGYADEADDLLILGATTHRFGRSWLINSCTRRSRCPVVVVPPPELARVAGSRTLRRLVLRAAEQCTPSGPGAPP